MLSSELSMTKRRTRAGLRDSVGTVTVTFTVTFDRSHSPTKLKVTCRVSKITSDEPSGARSPAIGCPEGDASTRRQIECAIDDPNQAKLPL